MLPKLPQYDDDDDDDDDDDAEDEVREDIIVASTDPRTSVEAISSSDQSETDKRR